MDPVKVDIVPMIEYSIEKTMGFFGRDTLTLSMKSKLKDRIKTGLKDASSIKAIGMAEPIPIGKIYQPIELTSRLGNTSKFHSLINEGKSIILKGSPGSGKSVFINWLLWNINKRRGLITIMFKLRLLDEVFELESFIKEILKSKAVKKKEIILLLIDGYDEIETEKRKFVSKILRKFSASKSGSFVLTSRYHYSVYELKCIQFDLSEFSPSDSLNYIKSYYGIYGLKSDPKDLIEELENRGFKDFLSNPLMLTLICVLKTGSMKSLPNNTLGLIKRALDTLTWRWDESKGINREARISLDGEHRIQLLRIIAFNFKSQEENELLAIQVTRDYLKKLQRTDVVPSELLDEIAKWYGIFVPSDESRMIFVHRTMHDYLAATFWVMTGEFIKRINSLSEWNTRAAYAACMIPDATKCLINSLRKSADEHVLMECIFNRASFRPRVVAMEIIKHIDRTNKYYIEYSEAKCRVNLAIDLIHQVSNELLIQLVLVSSNASTNGSFVVYVEGCLEAYNRGIVPFKEIAIRKSTASEYFIHEETIKFPEIVNDINNRINST